MKWKRCLPSRAAGSPLLMSKISSSSSAPDWSLWTSLRRMYSGVFLCLLVKFKLWHWKTFWSPFLELGYLYFNLAVPLDGVPSARTSCIHPETSTSCLCLDGACCVSSGWRSRACWARSSTLMSTFWTWFPMMGTCSPWSMKVLSGCVLPF